MGITRSGKVRWSPMDATELQHIELQCCCALSATQRPLSVLIFHKAHPKNPIILNPKSWAVQPHPNKLNKNPIDVNASSHDNLLTTKCIHANSLDNLVAKCFSENLTVTHASNHNLDEPQKELPRWHCKLEQRILQDIQELLRSGVLATTHTTTRLLHKQAANIGHPPKCTTCMFGKQSNCAKPGKHFSVIRE